MTSILDGFDTVQKALAAQQFALSITQKNVANANNPSYTREVVLFNADYTEGVGSGIPGVSLQANRDRFIDYSICRELQSLGKYSVAYDALKQIDGIFTGNGGIGLQQALSNFFNSFGSLASAPEDLNLRQQVLSSGNTLAMEFHRLYDGIQQVQISEDRALTYGVNEVNSLTAQIADLNRKIQEAEGANSENQFTLRDDRQKLLEQLSSLVDVSYHETESGSITVTTSQGEWLVLEDQSRTLNLGPQTAGAFRGVFLNGVDITASVKSGTLGGLIDVRDNKTTGYLNALDDLAAAIIARVNAQHVQGSDLNGLAGGDFFIPFTQPSPGSNTGAASAITVAITDPGQIAAAGAGLGVGNNDNAKLLAGINDEKLLSSSAETAGQFYANLIFRIGSDEKTAEDNVTTQNNVLDQLANQRDAFSGVNLDEEAISIIKYQKAYQASARFANVLDALSDEILQLLGV
jgi:flagellar hook-associated protein 1 FlgK